MEMQVLEIPLGLDRLFLRLRSFAVERALLNKLGNNSFTGSDIIFKTG